MSLNNDEGAVDCVLIACVCEILLINLFALKVKN